MTNAKIVVSIIARIHRVRFYRTRAVLILTMLLLAIAAATTMATAQTYSVVYNFDGTHGRNPALETAAILAQGRGGNLVGTTGYGGSSDLGVVFRITPKGVAKVLYNFGGGAHGSNPYSGLTLATGGNFYGTTLDQDASGTIFKITPGGSLTTLYTFETDDHPAAPPIQATDGDGYFYGTTSGGAAYKITYSGAFTPLGAIPGQCDGPLLQGTDGNFYGTTEDGGKYGLGTVFKITPKGRMTIVYDFDGTHGKESIGPVIQGSDGNFYGTTLGGGSYGGGVAFKLTPQGAITVLHNFPDPNYPNDGYNVWAGLVQATDGNFYGVTEYYEGEYTGLIFKLTPAGDYSILYRFDGPHGYEPGFTPMQHTNGKIYGLTSEGGTHGYGVVYSLDLGLAPFVRTLPTSGKFGRTVGILGGGLTGTSSVSFNGTPATFTVVSDTYVETTVPDGATTGFVTVTTPGGMLTSDKQFRVKP